MEIVLWFQITLGPMPTPVVLLLLLLLLWFMSALVRLLN